MAVQVETIIVGGGQGGLSVSYFLKQANHEHLVLEKAHKPGHAWRDDRWDSFTLVTPNWSFRLPGAEYSGDQPDGFMPRSEIVQTFENYVEHYQLPVLYGVEVTAVEPARQGYRVRTTTGSYRARNVVIATGLFQSPKIPDYAGCLPASVFQVHSGQYRNPVGLPDGAVLVAGSGQSGCQIAEELYQSGRAVYLCTGKAGRAPRRYRGRDIFEWLSLSGFLDRTLSQLSSPQARFSGNPQVTGKDGGHTLNLHQFARDGVQLLGRLADARDGKVFLAPDLRENLAGADELESTITRGIDQYIEKNKLEAPPETLPVLKDGFASPSVLELDLKAAGINTIIWAMGYRFDFSLVRLPVFEEAGFPIAPRGVTASPGLYFVGMPWLDTQKVGLLLGVGEAAKHVARQILARQITAGAVY